MLRHENDNLAIRATLVDISPREGLSSSDGTKSDPNGIRTRVTAVKGRCPRPLDDRVSKKESRYGGINRRVCKPKK
jgi:hypothetical protein